MPHLSPMPWILLTILFWLMLTLLIASSWWTNSMTTSPSNLALPRTNPRQWPW